MATEVLLIASQMPQQELGIIAQLLQTQGFEHSREAQAHPGVLVFETKDKANSVTLRFYQEIGALRLELSGEMAVRIGQALGQYMQPLTAKQLDEFCDKTNSDMERRLYTVLMVLTYPDAKSAMAEMDDKYLVHANDATREGLIQGLAFMESPDVGAVLEKIEKDYKGQPVADLARRAIDGLSAQGIVRESIQSFEAKIRSMVEDNPKDALELMEKYEEASPAPEIRALHAKALRLLGKMNEAFELVKTISASDPDAVEAYCERALLCEASGDTYIALADVERALALEPANMLASSIIKRLSLIINEEDDGEEDKISRYTKAIQNNPDDANLHCLRGECYLDENRPEDALKDFKDAIKLAPNDPRLPLLHAEAYLAMGMLGSALDWATRAQKTHSQSQDCQSWLIRPRVFLTIGRYDRALEAIHEIPTEIRQEASVLTCSGIVHELNDNDEEADREYAAALPDLPACVKSLHIPFYQDLPVLRRHLGVSSLTIATKPERILDKEPADPYFKRCDSCGALTMKRRTFCKECSNGTFFD